MKKAEVLLSGSSGQMGEAISKLLSAHKTLNLSQSLDSKSKAKVFKDKKKADVCIDFSHADFFDEILNYCVANKIPFVSGTTGISDKQKSAIKAAARTIPVLWAPNMSVGVNLLKTALKNLSVHLSDFEIHIEEIHHKRKKDSPSGTALLLKNAILEGQPKAKVDITSIRGGGVFGVHKVFAMSDGEVLSFEHTALNRTIFAEGAVLAARWIVGKKPGSYSMENLFAGK